MNEDNLKEKFSNIDWENDNSTWISSFVSFVLSNQHSEINGLTYKKDGTEWIYTMLNQWKKNQNIYDFDKEENENENIRSLEDLLNDLNIDIKNREFSDLTDSRAQFANSIAQLLVDKEGSIDNALLKWKPYDSDLEEYVRNIYEIDYLIPLKILYNFSNNDYTNWGLNNEEERLKIIKHLYKKCEEFYLK